MSTETTQSVPLKRGRKIDPNSTRTLHINPATGNAYPQGRIKAGTKVFAVNVHRSVNSSNYQHGVTPVVGEIIEKVISGGPEAAAAPAGNVQIHIIEPEPQVAEEPIKAAESQIADSPAVDLRVEKEPNF